MTNERWTEEQGREVVSAWRRSGRSMSAFCEQLGINVQRLSYWRERIGEVASGAAGTSIEKPRLVPGVVVGYDSCAGVVVQLPRGVFVEARSTQHIDPRWIAELVQELEGQQ